jgi:hypothetical protein
VKPESVLAVEAFKVPIVQLREYEDYWGILGQLDVKFLVILRLPGHLGADPALAAPPIRISE